MAKCPGEPKRAGGLDWEDYWSFRKDGSFYLARVFEEEYTPPNYTSSDGHPDRPFWFDLRIWRIAEAILHSASLYHALGIPPEEPYALAIGHHGLRDREFASSEPRSGIWRGSVCHVDSHSWSKELSQDLVTANLASLTNEVCQGLFMLFDFEEVDQRVVNAVVVKFAGSRR